VSAIKSGTVRVFGGGGSERYRVQDFLKHSRFAVCIWHRLMTSASMDRDLAVRRELVEAG
jgi:hypothetical protein